MLLAYTFIVPLPNLCSTHSVTEKLIIWEHCKCTNYSNTCLPEGLSSPQEVEAWCSCLSWRSKTSQAPRQWTKLPKELMHTCLDHLLVLIANSPLHPIKIMHDKDALRIYWSVFYMNTFILTAINLASLQDSCFSFNGDLHPSLIPTLIW